MLDDFCMDLLNNTGEWEISAKRCVQCGEIVDSVILLNRQLREDVAMQSRDGRSIEIFSTNQGRPGGCQT